MARSGLAVQLGSAPFARRSGNGLKGISIGRALRPINMHETDVHHRPKMLGQLYPCQRELAQQLFDGGNKCRRTTVACPKNHCRASKRS